MVSQINSISPKNSEKCPNSQTNQVPDSQRPVFKIQGHFKCALLIGCHELNEHQLENFSKGDDKLPFENDNYDMLETWNTICDLVKKGNV